MMMVLQNLVIFAAIFLAPNHVADAQGPAALTVEESNPVAANATTTPPDTTKKPAAPTPAPSTQAPAPTTQAPALPTSQEPGNSKQEEDGLQRNTTTSEDDVVSVLTFLGVVNGRMVTSPAGKTHFRFQGVPYAQPPVGTLRFLEPLPAAAWTNLDAFELRSPCAQVSVIGPLAGQLSGSEDCLYLNIYTPSLPTAAVLSADRSTLKPVMVWIHGGGFVEGSAGEYYPRALVEKDVVVVTINYRLGGLGFLTFGNSIVPGNMGLRDQLEALRWIQRYIHNFGGDPDRVTIFGESSGGVSVMALYLSPLSTGLFSAAIAQSGTMLMAKTAYDRKDQERSGQAVARIFGCESEELGYNTLACLQQVPVNNFLLNTTGNRFSVNGEKRGLMSWFPLGDSHATAPLIPLEPLHAMRIGAFRKVPLLTGTVKNEGALQVIMAQAAFKAGSTDPELLWNRASTAMLQVTAKSNASEATSEERAVADIARKYYTDGTFNLSQSADGWVDMFTDSTFLSPDQKTVQLISKHVANVYNYVLTFTDRFSVGRVFGATDNKWAPVHGDDLGYMMDLSLLNLTLTEREQVLADKMTTYWTNFAKYGNPSPFVSDDLPLWLPYADKRNYMELKPEPEMKNNLEAERMMFWQRIFWEPKESEYERYSLYQRLVNFFMGSQFPSLPSLA